MAIYQDIQITVNQGLAVPDKSLYIFRGDSNIILNFKLVTPQYMLTKDKKDNLVTRFGVDNFELRLQLEKGYDKIIRGVITTDGYCRTQLTQKVIQELRVGAYSYQITLIDDDNNAIMTFPVCKSKFNILDRMSLSAEELPVPEGLTGEAMTDLSLIVGNGKVLEAFDSKGNYIKTNWSPGDIISSAKLNKIEEAIYRVNQNNQSEHFDLTKKISTNYSNLNKNKADIDYVDEVVAKAQMTAASIDTSTLVFKSDYEPVADFVKRTQIMCNNIGEPVGRELAGKTVIEEYVDVDDYKYVSLTNSVEGQSYGIIMGIKDKAQDIERITIYTTLHEGNSLRVGVSSADFSWKNMTLQSYRDYEEHVFSCTPDAVPGYNPGASQYFKLFIGPDLGSSTFKASFKIIYTLKSQYKIHADEAIYAEEATHANQTDKALYADEAYIASFAGINPVKSENITMKSSKVIKTKTDYITYNIKKEANVDTNEYFTVVYIRIDCPNGITDLDRTFTLGFKDINTQSAIKRKCYVALNATDWNPSNSPIYFNGLHEDNFNLYEIIINDAERGPSYTDVDHVFVCIGLDYGSNDLLRTSSFEFDIAPVMSSNDGFVVANDITSECKENILADSFKNIRNNIHKIPIGVKRSKLEDYSLRWGDAPGIELSEANDGWIKCKKESTETLSQYAGVYVKIEYDNIDDLDGILSVAFRRNKGDILTNTYIMPRIGDWGPGTTGLIWIDVNSEFNLKERVLTATDFDYTNAHVLYVALIHYRVNGVTLAYDYDFKIDFTPNKQEIIQANAVSENLKNELIDAVNLQLPEIVDNLSIGVRYTDISKYLIRVNTDKLAVLTDLGDGWVKCKKEVDAPFANYAGVYVRFDYRDFDSLDGEMIIEMNKITGPSIDDAKILYEVTDWGNLTGQGTINVSVNKPFNLKEMLDRDDRTYKDRKYFYLCIVAYSSNGISEPFEYDYRVTFKSNNRKPLIATGLTDSAIEKLKETFTATSGKYITCWGDSLTAGGGWTNRLSTLSGLPVYNGGTGGENVRTIVARQGGDVMMINNLTIPADRTPVVIATRAGGGIPTQLGRKVTPLLQGGAHVNPCYIGDVKGTLKWTGSSYSDPSGTWTFTRDVAGEKVIITRPTAIRTDFDINRNAPQIMVIFIGQNGGYDNVEDLINQHRLMIEHSNCKDFVVLGLSSGSAESRAEYEAAMKKEFGRRFISLREYLSTPIYNSSSEIISCYGLDDAGLTMGTKEYNGTVYDSKTEIMSGTVPHQLLADAVHYTTETKTVIGNLIYKRIKELNMLD